MSGVAMATIALVHLMFGTRSRRLWPDAMTAATALSVAGASFLSLWKFGESAGEFRVSAGLYSIFQLLFGLSLVWFVTFQAKPRSLRIAQALSLGALGLSSLQFVSRISSASHLWAVAATLAMVSYVIAKLLQLCTQSKPDVATRLMLGFLPVVWIAYGYDLVVDYRMLSSPHLAGFASLGLVFVMSLSPVHETRQTIELSRKVQIGQSRWRSLLDGISSLTALCDSEGQILQANSRCAEAFGYTREELLGKNLKELMARDNRERVQTWWEKCSAGAGGGDQVAAQMTTKTGSPLRIVWSSVPLRGGENGMDEFVVTGEDVSRIHVLEAERDQAVEQLRQIKSRMETENLCLSEAPATCITSARIIGQSDALQYVLKKIQQVATTGATVLIEGETGVGKELVARAIHEASARARGAFIPVNCAALAPTLIESELFGHEKGAFTGADRQRKGRFEAADGGTIFLDEVGELPLDMQVKLLRVLQEGEFERVGSSTTRQANVRVIAATNRNLRDEIKAGRFREDLFYRLQVYPISVPALRERREDIPVLVEHFVRQLASKYGKQIDHIPGYLIADLKEREWPGNVRELINVVERAVIMTNGHTLAAPPEIAPCIDVRLSFQPGGGLMSLADNERAHILKVLEHTARQDRRSRRSGGGTGHAPQHSAHSDG